MPSKPLHDDQRLSLLLDALADSVESMSEDELLEEARAEGDPKVLASEVAATIREALETYRSGKRLEARREYEAGLLAMGSRTYALPASPKERRALLTALVARQPAIRSAVTLHNRELKGLSDADVEGYLRKLAELGLLDEASGGGE